MDIKAGQIVTVNWRKEPSDSGQDPQPPEPNKLRPAVVVQHTDLLDPTYPTVLVVPMTGNPALVIPDLTVVLQPSHQFSDQPSRIAAAPSVGGVNHRRSQLIDGLDPSGDGGTP